MGKLLEELKRRKVFRIAGVYAVVAWVLIQISDTLFPALQLPDWTVTFITVLLILGFFPVLIAAWAYETTPEGFNPDAQVQPSARLPASSPQPINYVILVVVLAVAGIQVFDRLGGDTTAPTSQQDNGVTANNESALHTNLNLGPIERRLPTQGNFITSFAFTPDGAELLYTSVEQGIHKLNIRNLEQRNSRILMESQVNIEFPRVSPNGERVLIESDNLFIVPIAGGTPRTIAIEHRANSIAWLDDDSFIYLDWQDDNVYHYSLDTQETEIFIGRNELPYFQSPQFIPSTNSLMFTANIDNTDERPGNPAVMLIDVDTGERKLLLDNAYDAQLIAHNQLVFMRGDDLWGAAFDSSALQLSGSPALLVNGIENESDYDFAAYTVSSSGLLIYLPGINISSLGESYILWRDASGNEAPIELESGFYQDMDLSPDGQKLAVAMHDGVSVDGDDIDLWTYDFNLPGLMNRVTTINDAQNPVWSVDQQHLYFDRRSRDVGYGVWRINASGVGEASRIVPAEQFMFPRSFGPNNELIMNTALPGVGPYSIDDILLVDPASEQPIARPLIATEYGEGSPNISPDGRLIAYIGNETGRVEVYVRPYPDVESNKWRVSTNGGAQPQWGANNVLYYLENGSPSKLITLQISYDSEFRVEERSSGILENYNLFASPGYAVDQTTGRLLFMKYVESGDTSWGDGEQLVVANLMSNFFAELERKILPVQN